MEKLTNRIKRQFFRLRLLCHSIIHGARLHGPFRSGAAAVPDPRDPSTGPLLPPLVRALRTHYVRQFNEASCSVATMATVLNALRAHLCTDSRKDPLTQQEILDQIRVANWRERVGKSGHNGRRGLPIRLLGNVTEQCLLQYGIPFSEMDVVPLDPPSLNRRDLKLKLVERLSEFEKHGHPLILAHFNQGVFVPTIHLPHISPVGAFDSKRNRVLILDVDPDQPHPYWVSVDRFYLAMTWGYSGLFETYGYRGGGYVWIRLNSRSLLNENVTTDRAESLEN